jgi:hypothetical protein
MKDPDNALRRRDRPRQPRTSPCVSRPLRKHSATNTPIELSARPYSLDDTTRRVGPRKRNGRCIEPTAQYKAPRFISSDIKALDAELRYSGSFAFRPQIRPTMLSRSAPSPPSISRDRAESARQRFVDFLPGVGFARQETVNLSENTPTARSPMG